MVGGGAGRRSGELSRNRRGNRIQSANARALDAVLRRGGYIETETRPGAGSGANHQSQEISTGCPQAGGGSPERRGPASCVPARNYPSESNSLDSQIGSSFIARRNRENQLPGRFPQTKRDCGNLNPPTETPPGSAKAKPQTRPKATKRGPVKRIKGEAMKSGGPTTSRVTGPTCVCCASFCGQNVAEGTFDYWYQEVKRAVGGEFLRAGLFPRARYFQARKARPQLQSREVRRHAPSLRRPKAAPSRGAEQRVQGSAPL